MTEGPAWAKGHPITLLKEVAAVFAQHDEGRTLGAFARVREVQVADWLERGDLHPVGGAPLNEATALVAARTATAARTITDWRRQPVAHVRPGDLVVSRIAGQDAGEITRHLLTLADGARIWITGAWAGHPVDEAVGYAIGSAWGTKIRASSETFTIWGPRPAEPITPTHPADLPGLAPIVPTQVTLGGFQTLAASLTRQVEALSPAFTDHYAHYNVGGSWSAVSLRGYADDPAFIQKPAEMSRKWKREHPHLLEAQPRDTRLRRALTAVEPVLAALPADRWQRIRLMQVAPGGALSRHADITDAEAGTSDGSVARIHVPLVTNPHVTFTTWGLDGTEHHHALPQAAGVPFYLDTRKPHAAINAGPTPRIHLVADAYATPMLRQALAPGSTDTPERLF